MVLTRLVVFVSLYYAISAASVSIQQGYLAMDTNEPASCHDMPNNQICPSFNDQVVGENKNPTALAKLGLHAVKLQLAVASFFQDTPACINDLREYSCSNTLMRCTNSSLTGYGFMLTYDVQRTQQACANVQASCSPLVQAGTIHNCSVIQTNPFEFAVCNKHTVFDGDICPSTDYTYSFAITKFYPTYAKSFKAEFPKYGAGALKNGTCPTEVVNVYCQIIRGAICTTDMQKRMYAISQQECVATIQNCVNPSPFQLHLLASCLLLPDGKTASRVPLPTVSSGNSANNANSGK